MASVDRREEERERRQRDRLRDDEEREDAHDLPEPDRAAVARREHEPVEHPLLPLGHERAGQREQRGEERPRSRGGRARRGRTSRPAARSGRRRASRRRRGASPAPCRASAARAAGSSARARRRRRSSVTAPAPRSRARAIRSGSWVETTSVRSPASSRELASSTRGALGVERRVRLVEEQQARVVEERPAEREPLRHPARERRDPLVPRVPQPVALEQHPDPLAPLRHAVEPAVELQVLERGQLAVDERLVREVADLAARRRRPRAPRASGASSPAKSASSVDLPEPFAPRDDEESAGGEVEVEPGRRRAWRRSAARGPRARITRPRPGRRRRRRSPR